MAKGRVPQLAPARELFRQKPADVVPRRIEERRRVGLERLHDDLSGYVAAASPGELRDELERALLRAEVGQGEPRVGVDDRGEGDAGEVVTLRHHLRADEDGAVGGGETLERLLRGAASRGRVRVETDARQLGTRCSSSASSRCVPAPMRASSSEPQAGQVSGTVSE